MNNLNNNKKIIFVIILILVIIVGYYFYSNYIIYDNNKGELIENDILIPENNTDLNNTNEEEKNTKIIVHVTGEVKKPGIVELEEGERIFSAIDKAGGTTKNADTSKINLAEIVEDGAKIYVPNVNDKIETEENINENKISISSNKESKQKIVNINTATQTELETLPGIGPSLAMKIINYRKEKGKFSKIEDIKNVSGIGDSKYNNIKSLIKVK